MRGKYEHAGLKNQNLSNKISENILFGMDLNKLGICSNDKGFSVVCNIKIKSHC